MDSGALRKKEKIVEINAVIGFLIRFPLPSSAKPQESFTDDGARILQEFTATLISWRILSLRAYVNFNAHYLARSLAVSIVNTTRPELLQVLEKNDNNQYYEL